MPYLNLDTVRQASGEGLIDKFKRDTAIQTALEQYGYRKAGHDEYISPNSKSGHRVKVYDEKIIVSLSSSDEGIGKYNSETGTHTANVFDLFLYYECGNDLKVAITKLKEKYPLPVKGTPSEFVVNTLEGFTFTDGETLAKQDFKPIVWLKDGLIPIPNLVLIAAAPKVGKSWYALGLARDISEAGNEVLYIANEDNERRLKERYLKVADRPNSKLRFLSGISSDRPIPKGKAALEFLIEVKTRYPNLRCIIIDTLQAIRDEAQKQDYGFVENEFSKLRKLAHQLNITIIAIHHTKKATDFDSSPLDKILGSQGIAATVETILILEQVTGSQDVNLFVTGKDVEQREDYRLSWTDAGFSDPHNRTMAELGSFQRAIVQYVKMHPCCMQSSIAEDLNRTIQQVGEAVNKLLERGILRQVEGKKLICLT